MWPLNFIRRFGVCQTFVDFRKEQVVSFVNESRGLDTERQKVHFLPFESNWAQSAMERVEHAKDRMRKTLHKKQQQNTNTRRCTHTHKGLDTSTPSCSTMIFVIRDVMLL